MASQTSQLLPNTAAVFGVIPCVLGVNALLRPRSGLEVFQFPLPASPEARKLTDNLLRIYGARDISIGLSTLIAWYFGDRKVLGWIIISGCVVTAVDGWVSKLQIGRGEWIHWGLTPVALGLGGGLLGCFDAWL